MSGFAQARRAGAQARPAADATAAPSSNGAEPAAAPAVADAVPAPRRSDTAWIDFARVAGMIAVVVAHVFSPAVRFDIADTSSAAYWAAATINAISRFCVPLFILISGALLLTPAAGLRPAVFYRRRLHRIGIPLAAWCALYLALRYFAADDNLNPLTVTREVAGGGVYYHLYFLFVLAGLYAITPFLRVVVLHASSRMLVAFAAVLIAIGLADQVFTILLQAGRTNAVTTFLPYAGYFVAGLLLARLPLSRRLVGGAAAAFVAGVTLTAVGGWALRNAFGSVYTEYFLQPLSPSVLLTSFGALILLRAFAARSPRITGHRVVATLSALTFGVYLVHPALLTQIRERVTFPGDLPGMLGTGLAILAAVLLASALITALGRRVPGLRMIF